MPRHRSRIAIVPAVLALLTLAALPATAAPVADVLLGSSQVQWVPVAQHAGYLLTISGPEGVDQFTFGPDDSLVFDLAAFAGDVDGAYNWELRATPVVDARAEAILADSRARGHAGGDRVRPQGLPPVESLVQAGTFQVRDGALVQPSNQPEPRPDLRAAAGGHAESVQGNAEFIVAADQVFADDVIVQGSICVGFDCVNNENFGFDTIRLKENNTRIKFDDTSSSGSFPNTDWQLTANDSQSGGANKFSIEDITAARVPFTIEGASPSNSIYVDSTGRIGFRTTTPALDLHVSSSNSPGLRLDQNSSGGFSAQSWDLAGNEVNFFVRDVTNGSRLPFRIRPGAPTSSIDIAASGNVGLGTASPSASLHITRSDGTAQILLSEQSSTEAERTILDVGNNGVAVFVVEDTSADGSRWSFEAEGPSFRINKGGTGGEEMIVRDRFDATGNATLVVNGSVQATNVTFSSSRDLKTAFEEVDGREVLAKLASLPMSSWSFKEERNGRRHLGPIAEDFNQLFQLGADPSHISVLDANGVTMIAVQALYEQALARETELAELRAQVEKLTALLHASSSDSP